MKELNYENFLIYLRLFQKRMQKKMNEDLRKLGISSTHVGIIMILKNSKEGISMSNLSRMIKVDNALMTRNIKELEKINYIYRNRENESQRKYHICLTEDGEKIAKKLCSIMEQKQKKFIEKFTPEEKNIIEKAVQIVYEKFGKEIEKEEKTC